MKKSNFIAYPIFSLAILLAGGNFASAEEPQITCQRASPGKKLTPETTITNTNGRGSGTVPATSCGFWHMSMRNKFGNCNASCDIGEVWQDWESIVKGSSGVTGKRMTSVKSTAKYRMAGFWAQGGCSDNNENAARTYCGSEVANLNGGAPSQTNYYCPDAEKAEYRNQGAIVSASCDQFNPANHCSQYEPQYNCNNYFMYGGSCTSLFPAGEEEYCCGSSEYYADQMEYNQCYNTYQTQYNSCVNQLVAGETECYCKQTGGVPMYYKFDTSVGAWRCRKCSDDYPAGYVEDPTNGSSCKAPCNAGMSWDAVTNTCINDCENRPGMSEVLIGSSRECLPDCAPNETRPPGERACKKLCPDGMDVSNGLCVCSAPNFNNSGTPYTRVPVEPRTLSTTPFPAWAAAPPILANGSTTTGFACGCSMPGSPVQVAVHDTYEAIISPSASAFPVTSRPAYGIVGVMTSAAGAANAQYSCGCPNFNEKFEVVGGVARCVPKIAPAAANGEGLVLAPVDQSRLTTLADRTLQGIRDAFSDRVTAPFAMLRSQSSGTDLAMSYARKVWRCADGYKLNGNGTACVRKGQTPADILAESCSDTAPGTTIASSLFVPATVQGQFANLTNRNLACCLSRKPNDTTPAKYHCLGTDAQAYESAPGAGDGFNNFYNAGSAGGQDWNGLAFPNRFFLRDSNGRAVTGIYRKDGSRCNLIDGLPANVQLGALNTVIANAQANRSANPFAGIAGVTASARDQQECRFVLRTAIEMSCPANIAPGPGVALNSMEFPATSGQYRSAYAGLPANTVRRCFTPSAIRVHYELRDMSDSSKTGTVVHRSISSVGANGEATNTLDPAKVLGN